MLTKSFAYLFWLILILKPGQDAFSQWSHDNKSWYSIKNGEIRKFIIERNIDTLFISKKQLIPENSSVPLDIEGLVISNDDREVLIVCESKKVWQYYTRSDFWVLNRVTGKLKKLGEGFPPSSLMYAQFSSSGEYVAYVSRNNIYLESVKTSKIKCLTTTNAANTLINGTFDWAYEEELNCRIGFRWSPDGTKIAYWQIDCGNVPNYLMLNTVDSLYPFVIPIEYPVARSAPPSYKIGVVDINDAKTKWINIPGDHSQTYLTQMEWALNSNELIMQQLNRKQNESRILLSDTKANKTRQIYYESDSAYIECKGMWQMGEMQGWYWLNGGKEFLWVSEKDGWRHVYRIPRDGGSETLVTKGKYDIMMLDRIDEKNNYLYFDASPYNATQRYLYRTSLDGKGPLERLSPENEPGSHYYYLSRDSKYARHYFSNAYTKNMTEYVCLPNYHVIGDSNKIPQAIDSAKSRKVNFFKVTTTEGIEMDGWMVKPDNFDSTKKYPVIFYVYGLVGEQTVVDSYGVGQNYLYSGDMAADGYIQISLDNRGTPSPKGRTWRKCIYRKIGRLNISDQALAAKEILKWPFVDSSRIAVWGWSEGGSTALNLMFQHPEIYKVGVAISPITDLSLYDNIFEERYMGLFDENKEDYINGSPITYARNLKGKLLLVHGTGDDNVHYQHAEKLINELIKYNKVFSFMEYPNRSHSLSEGSGTYMHLSATYTDFIRQNCPGGGR
jgi:dipeptidyl-peptidase 4